MKQIILSVAVVYYLTIFGLYSPEYFEQIYWLILLIPIPELVDYFLRPYHHYVLDILQTLLNIEIYTLIILTIRSISIPEFAIVSYLLRMYYEILRASLLAASITIPMMLLITPTLRIFLESRPINEATRILSEIVDRHGYILVMNHRMMTIEKKPLTREIIEEKAPLRFRGKGNASVNIDLCSICREELSETQLHRLLPCQHCYHANCIDDWLIRNPECPFCRQKL